MKADFLVTPKTDVPLILETQVIERSKVSVVFHSKQLIIDNESNLVHLQFFYKHEIARPVHHCESKAEAVLITVKNGKKQHAVNPETNLTQPCDEEVEQICSLAIPDRGQQNYDRRALLREFRDVFAFCNERQRTWADSIGAARN